MYEYKVENKLYHGPVTAITRVNDDLLVFGCCPYAHVSTVSTRAVPRVLVLSPLSGINGIVSSTTQLIVLVGAEVLVVMKSNTVLR